LWANKLRTVLTLLGNIVGMMSVIAVVSVLTGIDSYVRQEVAQEGSNRIVLRRYDPFTMLNDFEGFTKSLHNPAITLHDVDYLRAYDPTGAATIGSRASTTMEIRARGRTIKRVPVEGRSAFYPLIDDFPLAAGRHFSLTEEERNRPVAVIGREISEKLFAGGNPIGRPLSIGGRRLEVIGLLEERAGALESNPNQRVVVPIGLFFKIFGSRRSVEVPIKAVSVNDVEPLQEEVRLAMRIRRGLKPSDRETFAVTSAENLVSLWKGISRLLFLALTGIVSIALVVGGIVVMNIMLVSVTERTREIGLRKAVGAQHRHVVWQFMFEAVTLSVVGGAGGVLIGFAVAVIIAAFTPLPYSVELWAIMAGLIVTLGVGLVFGIYPAVKAARLDPVEALRRE